MPDAWIRQSGDPVLRQPALEVVRADDILRAQVTRMRRSLLDAAGAGLAATQVGLMRRLFVFRTDPENDVDVLVNPRIVGRSQETATFHEGCLSYNSIVVALERPAAVRVEGADLDGCQAHARGGGLRGLAAAARDRPPGRRAHARPCGARRAAAGDRRPPGRGGVRTPGGPPPAASYSSAAPR